MGGAVACKKIEEVMACVNNNNTTGTLGLTAAGMSLCMENL